MLHEFARASLPAFGLAGGSLSLLQDLVNSSFRVQHESGEWYLRIYHPTRHDIVLIESELVWLEVLGGRGFRVPRPRRTLEQALVWGQEGGVYSDRHWIAVWTWLTGQPMPNEERRPDHFFRVGSLLGRLHNVAASWSPPPGFRRPRCDAEGVYGEGSEQAWRRMPVPLRSDLVRAREALQQAEAEIGWGSDRYGLVHGDPSFGNILFDRDEPALIDFDDCGYGHYLYDLAVVLAGAWGKAGFAEKRSALLEGYREVRALSAAEVTTLPAAMAARAASLILWAVRQTPQHPWIEGQWRRLNEYLQ